MKHSIIKNWQPDVLNFLLLHKITFQTHWTRRRNLRPIDFNWVAYNQASTWKIFFMNFNKSFFEVIN